MREYELVCVFQHEQEMFTKGKQAVAEAVKAIGAEIVKEDDMGERDLAYAIQDRDRGHYFLWVFKVDPAKVIELEAPMKLMPELLRHLVSRVE